VLQQRGLAHENAYLEHLQSKGLSIANLRDIANENAACCETVAAMASGVDVIAQPVMVQGRWLGRADVLRKVPRPSKFGGWSYEVYDCKSEFWLASTARFLSSSPANPSVQPSWGHSTVSDNEENRPGRPEDSEQAHNA
jgi:hypothetical protein